MFDETLVSLGQEMARATANQFANKTALHMHYAATTTEADSAREMMEQAFLITANFLDRLNPEEIRYHAQHLIAEYSTSDCLTDPERWMRFLASQGDLLHQMGFQHKSVASIGNKMARWDRQPVSFFELGDALDKLYQLVGVNSPKLVQAMRRTAFDQITGPRLARRYSELVVGLAIIEILTTDSSEILKVGEDLPALYSFAASLVVECVKHLDTAAEIDSRRNV